MELSKKLEKSADLPREEFASINHELSTLDEKFECYKKYLVSLLRVFYGLESYNRN